VFLFRNIYKNSALFMPKRFARFILWGLGKLEVGEFAENTKSVGEFGLVNPPNYRTTNIGNLAKPNSLWVLRQVLSDHSCLKFG
jgi:hypothetical protein